METVTIHTYLIDHYCLCVLLIDDYKWHLEGSNDGVQWTTLKSHVSETTACLTRTAAWPVANTGRAFRHFHIHQARTHTRTRTWLAGSLCPPRLLILGILPLGS